MDMHFSGSVSQIVSNPFVFYKLIDNQINLSLSMKKKKRVFFFILYFILYLRLYTSGSLYESRWIISKQDLNLWKKINRANEQR